MEKTYEIFHDGKVVGKIVLAGGGDVILRGRRELEILDNPAIEITLGRGYSMRGTHEDR